MYQCSTPYTLPLIRSTNNFLFEALPWLSNVFSGDSLEIAAQCTNNWWQLSCSKNLVLNCFKWIL